MFASSSPGYQTAFRQSLLVLLLTLCSFTHADPVFAQEGLSKNKEANLAMSEAQKVFPAQLDKAAAFYAQAYQHDPTLYEAALYAGNSYFMMKQYEKAGEWLAKAVAINPDRETAHRYWAGALMMSGRVEEARAKYIQAIIAEPYNPMTWQGLVRWAQRNGARLAHPQIQPPNSITAHGSETTLNVQPEIFDRKDGSNHWLMYDLTRVSWLKGEFFKRFPNEKEYRHSLAEELAALQMVADFAEKDLKAGQIKSLAPDLATLVRLKNDNLLAAYILLSKPDQGIAQDYVTYRQQHHAQLVRYINEYLVAKDKPEPPLSN